jgi:hypothetical protein
MAKSFLISSREGGAMVALSDAAHVIDYGGDWFCFFAFFDLDCG